MAPPGNAKLERHSSDNALYPPDDGIYSSSDESSDDIHSSTDNTLYSSDDASSDDDSSDDSDSDDSLSDSDSEKSLDIQDNEDFMWELKDCLDDMKTEPTFSSFSVHKSYVNPGLHITGYGSVGLPLVPRDAEAILKICKQSPFGKGAESVVDASVRRTWELDISEFECQNPAWINFVDRLLKKQAVGELGLQRNTQAQLYKMELYEKGAFFKAQKNTKKVPGMLGTLVVCLPSGHTGGIVRLEHGSAAAAKIIQTENDSRFGMATLSWYSDVEHSMMPVLSGYRLVLTYNLVQDQHPPELDTASLLSRQHSHLAALLRAWQDDNRNVDYGQFVHPLHYEYTNANLCLRDLRGVDAAKGCWLEQTCAKNGAYWFIGTLTKTRGETGLTVNPIVTPAGEQILNSLSVDKDQFTGVTEDTLPVLILMRKKAFFGHFTSLDNRYSGANTFNAFVGMVHGDMLVSPEDDDSTLQAMLNWMLAELGKDECDRNRNAKISQYFEQVRNFCYTNERPHVIRQALFRALQQKNMASCVASCTGILDILVMHLSMEVVEGNTPAWDYWFPQPPPSLKHLIQKAGTFKFVESRMPLSARVSFKQWGEGYFERGLRKIGTYTVRDVPSLVALVPLISSNVYISCVMPAVRRNGSRPMMQKYLHELSLYPHSGDGKITARKIFEESLNGDLDKFKLTQNNYSGHEYEYNPDSFMMILRKTVTLDLDKEALRLVTVVLADALRQENAILEGYISCSGRLFRCDWINDLAWLPTDLVRIPDYHPNAQVERKILDFFVEIIRRLALALDLEGALVQSSQALPTDWKRKPRNTRCNCDPCLNLHGFLADPTMKTGRFRYNENIRKHLESSVSSIGFDVATDKTAGIPFTLVIEKNLRGYRSEKDQYKKKVERIREDIKQLLRRYSNIELQAEFNHFERLLANRATAIASSGTQGGPSLQLIPTAVQNSRTLPPVAGVKRKVADNVDLNKVARVKRKVADVVNLTEGASD